MQTLGEALGISKIMAEASGKERHCPCIDRNRFCGFFGAQPLIPHLSVNNTSKLCGFGCLTKWVSNFWMSLTTHIQIESYAMPFRKPLRPMWVKFQGVVVLRILHTYVSSPNKTICRHPHSLPTIQLGNAGWDGDSMVWPPFHFLLLSHSYLIDGS